MVNYEIIDVDVTNLKVTCVCGQCRSIIASRKCNPEINENEIEVPFFIRCPKCGIRFQGELWKNGIRWKKDSENCIYLSDLLNVVYDEIQVDSIKHIKGDISYYEEMLNKFNKGCE